MTIKQELAAAANSEKARFLAGFFKTGKGQYGEGDRFLGVTVPVQRKIARKHRDLTRSRVADLLSSGYHEHRLTALLILVSQYERGTEEERRSIYDFYLRSLRHVNNWDLVDLSAPRIVGAHMLASRAERKRLSSLVKGGLWERRIAVLATYAFIRENQFEDTLRLARLLLRDPEELMHKAVGWMLREVGKRDLSVETDFLDRHAARMPRTMLRYAIERFPERRRKAYLAQGKR